MKKLLLFVLIAISFGACKHAEDAGLKSVTPVITAGQWRVNLLLSNGVNGTAAVNPYKFRFYTTGVVQADREDESILGRWSEGTDKQSINLSFDATAGSLVGMNKNWYVMDITNGLINFDAPEEAPNCRLVLSY